MRVSCSSLFAPVALLCIASCSISTRIQYQDVPLGSRSHARTIPAGQYEVSARVEGVAVNVSINEVASCESGQVHSIRRTEHRLRTAHPAPWTLAIPGLALTGLGVGTIFGGQAVATQLGFPALGDSPLAAQILGGAISAGGVGLILGSIIHAIRARDTHRDLGIVEMPDVRVQSCRAPVAAGTIASLTLSENRQLRTAIDSHSQVSFPLLDVTSDLLPKPQSPLSLQISDKTLSVSLSQPQHRMLLSNLLSDERSVARQELLARRQQACSEASDDAEKLGIPSNRGQVPRALLAWERAQEACGPLFSQAMGERRLKVQEVQDRFKAEDAMFASALLVSDDSNMDELAGKFVRIEKTVSESDAVGGLIKFEREQRLCMSTHEPRRTRWGRGRGGGRGGGRGWGGGRTRGGSSWFRSSSPSTSNRSKSKRRWYGGGVYSSPMDTESTVNEARSRIEPERRCQTKKKVVLIFRLAHPSLHRLRSGDFVKVFATATPSGQASTMYLVEPRIALLTRGTQVLISESEGSVGAVPEVVEKR